MNVAKITLPKKFRLFFLIFEQFIFFAQISDSSRSGWRFLAALIFGNFFPTEIDKREDMATSERFLFIAPRSKRKFDHSR